MYIVPVKLLYFCKLHAVQFGFDSKKERERETEKWLLKFQLIYEHKKLLFTLLFLKNQFSTISLNVYQFCDCLFDISLLLLIFIENTHQTIICHV